MKLAFIRFMLRVRRGLKAIVDPIIGLVAVAILRLIRRGDRVRFANRAGRFMRRVGPWLSNHKVGRANLAAAFPEKSADEIEQILAGVWDNLGRVAVEFAYLDRFRIIGEGEPIDVTADPITLRRIEETRRAPRPTAAFAAHLGNWEIGALAAARLGVDVSLLYR